MAEAKTKPPISPTKSQASSDLPTTQSKSKSPSPTETTCTSSLSTNPDPESLLDCAPLPLIGLDLVCFKHDLIHALHLTKHKRLGRGASGEVVLVQSKKHPERLYAMKRCHVQPQTPKYILTAFYREVVLTKKLSHPHIIGWMYPVLCQKYTAIFLPYYPMGSLTLHIKEQDKSKTELFFKQLASAVKYLHEKKIVHRDIKLDNILVEKSDWIILADFGLAREVENGPTFRVPAGSLRFMAPEVRALTKDRQSPPYNGYLADSYSCGVVLWSMLMRVYPQRDVNYVKTIEMSSKMIGLPHLQDMAIDLLASDPGKRKSISGVAKALKL